MSLVRVFIAGLGQIGFRYDAHLDPAQFAYSHTRAFTTHPAFTLVGACDPSPEAQQAFTANTGVPAFTSIDQAPTSCVADLLVVATPTDAHGGAVRAGLARWPLRGVLCEKPLASDVTASATLVADAAAAGVPLWVNYVRRAEPGVVRVRAMIADGTIATPLTGVVWYSKGLVHNGSHLLDMMGFWLGSWQHARGLGDARGADADLDVQFANGRILVLAAREDDYSHYTAELVSPSGRLRYDLNGASIVWQPAVPHPTLAGYRVVSPEPEPIASDLARYQWHVANRLVDALAGRPHPLATGADALALHRHLHDVLTRTRP